jgi:hypothetical protein
MGMKSLLNFGLAPMLVKKLIGDGDNDAVKRAIADYDKERQEKEKAEQEKAMSGRPGMPPAMLPGGGPAPGMGLGMGPGMKRGGAVKKMAKGGSASSRADGCATKGKTKGRFV